MYKLIPMMKPYHAEHQIKNMMGDANYDYEYEYIIWLLFLLSEVGGSLLRCGMLSGKICEDQR
jgi:hypothetical protein